MIRVDVRPGVDPAVVEKRLDELLSEFLAKQISKDELERAQTRIVASNIRGLEKVGGFSGKAVTLAQGELYAGDPGFIRKELEWVAAATPKEIHEVARDWLGRGSVRLLVTPFPKLAAAGKGIDRSKGLPKVGDTPDLDFPAIVEDHLSNGLRVVLAERHAVPIVQVALQFDAGYAADSLGKLGVASMTLDMLDEGTKKRTGEQIAKEAERLGAQISTGSDLDTSTVSLNAITTNLDKSLDLFADVVRHPRFAKEDLERLKVRRIAGIQQEQNQPIAIALRQLPPLLYGKGHAYGIPFTGSGTIPSVKGITREDLVAFQKAWLRPDNATVFVVGDTTMAKIKPLLEKYFGDWKAPETPLEHKNIARVEGPKKSRIIIIDRPGSPQSLILAGHLAPPTGDPDNIALGAANEILGGAFTARINMDLREDKGWSYGAYSFMQGARGQRPFLIYAPVQTDKTAQSVKQLILDLNEFLGDKPPSEEELDRVIKNNTRSLPGRFETSAAVLGAVLANARFGRPLNYQEQLKELYGALDLAKVRAAGRRLVHPDRLIWLIVGDKAKIADDLKKLDIATIEEASAAR
ncbi:MAG: insulinase family protein [Alphaproteobacteria bacterium]|nr:MAG: insulinase family protein [Alphaproteobacteria bacterium]